MSKSCEFFHISSKAPEFVKKIKKKEILSYDKENIANQSEMRVTYLALVFRDDFSCKSEIRWWAFS